MLTVRLKLQGKMKNPFYRVVVTDSRRKNSGISQEIIGYFKPGNKEAKIDEKKLRVWIKKGAKITPSVKKLLTLS